VDLHDGKISVYSAGEGKGTCKQLYHTIFLTPQRTELMNLFLYDNLYGTLYEGSSFTVEIPMQRASTEIRISDESFPKEVDLLPFISPDALYDDSVDNEDLITIHHVEHSAMRSQSNESSLLLVTDLKMTILVVDDSRLNRKMLMKCLQSDGESEMISKGKTRYSFYSLSFPSKSSCSLYPLP
jgi:CheY-like chemotaxis protein